MFDTLVTKTKARWVTGVFFFLSGIITATWSSRIPEMQKKLGLNDAEWGATLFALPVGLFVGLPISSWATSTFGPRRIMVYMSAAFATVLLLLGFCERTWMLVCCLFFFGLSRNATNISINTYSLRVQKLYETPIISSFHGIWSVACFLAAAIGVYMIAKDVAPVWHFAIIAVVCITTSIIFRSTTETPTPQTERRPFFILPDRYLFLLGLIAFCSMICEGTMFDWSVSYFRKVVNASKEMSAIGYTSFIVAMATGRLIGDRLIGRFGYMSMLMFNGLVMAIGFSVAILFPVLFAAAIGFLLVGLGNSIIVPIVYACAGNTLKMPPAYAIASVTLVGYSGFLLGPLAVGNISQAFGMKWSFALMALLSLLIIVLALLVRRKSVELVSEE
ncbi:MAG TPA: MFS transporter [Chitinophagaceae bacterium]|nr:MFS transporter [Chitinophagaceae bacterium]